MIIRLAAAAAASGYNSHRNNVFSKYLGIDERLKSSSRALEMYCKTDDERSSGCVEWMLPVSPFYAKVTTRLIVVQ